MVADKVESKPEELSGWTILVGWGFALVYLLIVGFFPMSYFWSFTLGMVMFMAAFGAVVALNWEWSQGMLDFDVEDIFGGGSLSTSIATALNNVKGNDTGKDTSKGNDTGKNNPKKTSKATGKNYK